MPIQLNELAHFTGSERWFRHWFGGALHYTEGVHYLAENGAAWLVDAIASHQLDPKLKKGDLRDFQLWTLEVTGSKGVLTVRADTDVPPAITQEIEYTDFPEGKLQLYAELGSIDGVNTHRVLMLTSER